MSEFGFGSTPVVVNDAGLDVAVSLDRQAFTVTFSALEVIAEEGTAAPMATRVASLVVPVQDVAEGTQIALRVSGFAFIQQGATGLLTMTANGRATTEYLSPGLDNEFVYELRIDATGASACRVSLFLVAERDSGMGQAIARFNVLSMDGELIGPTA